MSCYRELFSASLHDPETFWAQAAQAVSWLRPPQQVFDDSRPPFCRWYPDATLNTCANALDRHVADGRAEQAALIYDSPVTGVKRTYTYGELLDQTARFVGALRDLGVAKGDRVVLACFKQVDVVPAFPKTRSGKILRKTMRDMSQGKDGPVPSTIEDPEVLQLLRPILQS